MTRPGGPGVDRPGTRRAGGLPNAAACTIRAAGPADVADLLAMIRALAEYEKLTHLVVADEARLADALFGPRPVVEALIARAGTESGPAAGFALFFHTFSTFLGRPGLWLEDLFVYPTYRGTGLGRRFLAQLAALARARGCGRFEWSVLDWNTPAIAFYEAMGATLLPDWRIARVTGAALERFGLEAGAAVDGTSAPRATGRSRDRG